MSRKFASSLVALAMISFCGVSQADSVTFSGYSHGSQSVTATLTAPNNAPLVRTVNAGGFNTSLNGGPSFEAYCVDLYQNISFGPTYTDYFFAGLGHVFTNLNAYADLSRLYATAGLVNDAIEEAAFQIAVWEIAYEATGSPYNLSGGVASFAGGTAATSGALTLATTWLTNLASGGPTITVMDSREHQDIIFAPIPEPETYALFMAGLAAVGFMARRRKT